MVVAELLGLRSVFRLPRNALISITGLAVAWCVLSPGVASADVTVTTTTTPHGGQFAPRNVVATWVEDANGGFIKTISRWANTRKSHLVAWIAKAGANDADAISGATRQNHAQPVLATWDLKDKAGVEVPDGTYAIRMELADSDSTAAAQNDQGTYTFVKNTAASTQNSVTSGGFTATIKYTPDESPTCNNGVIDPGETYDPSSSCPTACPASADACLPNVLEGSAAGCTSVCVVRPITGCIDGDGCCPAGCDSTSDSDCKAVSSSGGGNETGDGVSGGCDVGGGGQLVLGWLVLGIAVGIRGLRRTLRRAS